MSDVLERDFAEHARRLVLRADRARCHTVPDVLEVLRRHDVLLLQGPPRHPGYYGQLEHQNREQRAWLAMAGRLGAADIERLCDEMLLALNGAWPRRSLTWRPGWNWDCNQGDSPAGGSRDPGYPEIMQALGP